MNLIYQSLVMLLFSTVQPEEKDLAQHSHLIALGQITSVREYSQQELEIKIDIKKIIKGSYKESSLSFFYPNQLDKGHRFKSCIGKKLCSEFVNQTQKFYLNNRDINPHYQKLGLKGWQLTDAWFGITSP